MFEKNNHMISISGHCLRESHSWEPSKQFKKLSDWKKRRYHNGLCNEPFTSPIYYWYTLFGLFSIFCYGFKTIRVHDQKIYGSNVKLVKMHMSSTTTNHFYLCSYFCTPVLMQLGEEGGIDDQIVSSFTFKASASFFPLYLRTNILYASFVESDSILGQF